MQCNECEKNKATIHVTKITNGVKEETYLCEECAKKQQVLLNMNIFKDNKSPKENLFSLKNFLAGMLDEKITEEHLKTQDVCDVCGTTFYEFRKTGKLGCGNCLSVFRNSLIPAIKNIQGFEAHAGKIPKRAEGKHKLEIDIELLKKELKSKIEQEEFEDAANIRDQIKEMERIMKESLEVQSEQ